MKAKFFFVVFQLAFVLHKPGETLINISAPGGLSASHRCTPDPVAGDPEPSAPRSTPAAMASADSETAAGALADPAGMMTAHRKY